MSRDRSHVRTRRLARLLLCAGAAAGLGGCAARHPVPTVRVQAQPAAEGMGSALPELPVAQIAPAAEGRIQLDIPDADVRAAIQQIAAHFNLDYEIDPAVGGRVSARVRNATLEEALAAVLGSHGLSYSVQERVLRVTPSRLQTRIFHLDYIALSRTSFGVTSLQRSLGNPGGGVGGGGALGGGAGGLGATAGGGLGTGGGGTFIVTSEGADLWNEVRVALVALVLDQSAEGTAAGGVGAAGGLGGGMGMGLGGNSPTAYSQVGEDGRRLIINPTAGTIVVTAAPDVLAQVETFIRAFESSIQRQVLIEAKVVEVLLNRRFQFGVDWTGVQRVGGVGLNIQTGAAGGNVALTLTSPGDRAEVDGISLVLRALAQQGDIRVLSSPHVSVLNNQRAVFNVSTDEVFFKITRQPILGPTGGTIGFTTEVEPQTIAVGISLDVLAQIAPSNVITMNVRPAVTNVVRIEQVTLDDGTQLTAPVIDRRETDTVVRVRHGETIIIGGLMQTTNRNERTGIPLLRDIPLLGSLFTGLTRQNDKRELVIFLTPRIVAGQVPVGQE